MKKYLLLLISIFFLASCSKDNDIKQADESPKKIEEVVFDGNISGFEVVDFAQDQDDDFRAVVLTNKNNDRPPFVSVTNESIGGKGRWVIAGRSQMEQVTAFGTAPYQNGGWITTNADGTSRVHLTFTWTDGPNRCFYEGQYGVMYIGGDRWNNDVRKQDYNPNGNNTLVSVTETGNITRDIPFVTMVTKLKLSNEKPNNSTLNDQKSTARINTNFKPQGCLFALNFENKTGRAIQIQSINRESDNDIFYYHGQFTMVDFQEGANGPGSKYWDEDTYPIPFEGNATTNTDFMVVANANGDKINLNNDALSTGRVYLWAYPKDNLKNSAYTLRVKFAYADDPNTTVTSKTYSFTAPSGGWTSGKCYRGTVKVTVPKVVSKAVSGGINPLSYVAEYNINETGSGFATDHELAHSAYFTFDEAKAIAGKINSYVLPSIEQWRSIYSAEYDVDFERTFDNKASTIGVVVGSSSVSCKSHFTRVGSTVYAMRYEGDNNYASAWSYHRNATGFLTIKCLRVAATTTLQDILAEPDVYFNDPQVVVREFAALGSFSRDTYDGVNDRVVYWSASRYNDRLVLAPTSSYQGIYEAGATDTSTAKEKCNIRLFKESL